LTSSLHHTRSRVITVPFLLILIAFIEMGRFNAEDRSLICNMRTHKGRGSTRMIKEFPSKMWKRRAVDYLIKKIDFDGTTAMKPGTHRSHLSPREIARQTVPAW